MRVVSYCVWSLVIAASAIACKKSEPAAEKATPGAAPLASAAPAAEGPHADEMKLPTLGPVPIPETNPMSDEKVALGNQLFFDKRLSADGSRACYSCHQNADGTGGHDPLAVGAKGKQLTRHSPVMWNVGYLPRFYWDGRSNTLEDQGTAAWAGGNMGVGKENLEAKAKEIAKIKGYKTQFDKVFPGQGVTPETIVQAIAAYERTLVCDDTAYDRFAKGDKSALNAQQTATVSVDSLPGVVTRTAWHNPAPSKPAGRSSPSGLSTARSATGIPASTPSSRAAVAASIGSLSEGEEHDSGTVGVPGGTGALTRSSGMETRATSS